MLTGAPFVGAYLSKTPIGSLLFLEDFNAINAHYKQALFLTAGDNNTLYMSGRNIPTLTVMAADKASMYEIWKSRAVIAEESAIKIIEDSFLGLAAEKPEVSHISVPA